MFSPPRFANIGKSEMSSFMSRAFSRLFADEGLSRLSDIFADNDESDEGSDSEVETEWRRSSSKSRECRCAEGYRDQWRGIKNQVDKTQREEVKTEANK